ncbi:MAG: hypothetical protein QM715_10960 [Nibricoccus sp.]
MKKYSSLRRIVFEAAGLILLHYVLLQVLAKARWLEHLLAPGGDSFWPMVFTATFLCLRVFLYIFVPGFLAARIWLGLTRAEIDSGKSRL